MSETETKIDFEMTRRALELASKGAGLVSPSPLVGCVIVASNGKIVGEGTFLYENVVHAEKIALEQAGARARGGTAYISLEPHNYMGRTQPCTDLLINAGIRRVVSTIEDPNPRVRGKGFAQLREAGVEVVTGVLEKEAYIQNEKFIGWHQNGRPFVHLKLAESLDGRISLNESVSTAITGGAARERVHALRHEYDAILIGANTAVVDNPNLTDRSGRARRLPLTRVVLDTNLSVNLKSRLVQTANEIPTIVVSDANNPKKIEELSNCGVTVISENPRDLPAVIERLNVAGIQSVLVEGGSQIAGSFIDSRLVDKVTFFIAPLIIGGKKAPTAICGNGVDSIESALRLRDVSFVQHGADFEISGYPNW
ncbi:MAG: bifunctional diaminohydroxyphosphoribosylaminopyrimidine deaminase/5-amino-6-(5-phosphoribosylamino)uracil reductase RibD [Pyrinomonadaceae bacterium]